MITKRGAQHICLAEEAPNVKQIQSAHFRAFVVLYDTTLL